MPNAIAWVALAIACGAIGAVGATVVFRRRWQELGLNLVRLEIDRSKEKSRADKAEAFARAAEAVCLWPHRIDKKADLARHLESLATAPELGVANPNTEATTAVESPSNDSPVPLAAPVPAREDVLDPATDDERVVDTYRLEGFL